MPFQADLRAKGSEMLTQPYRRTMVQRATRHFTLKALTAAGPHRAVCLARARSDRRHHQGWHFVQPVEHHGHFRDRVERHRAHGDRRGQRHGRRDGRTARTGHCRILRPTGCFLLEKTKRLLSQEKVAVIFGCWTSVSRKLVLPVVKEMIGLLF